MSVQFSLCSKNEVVKVVIILEVDDNLNELLDSIDRIDISYSELDDFVKDGSKIIQKNVQDEAQKMPKITSKEDHKVLEGIRHIKDDVKNSKVRYSGSASKSFTRAIHGGIQKDGTVHLWHLANSGFHGAGKNGSVNFSGNHFLNHAWAKSEPMLVEKSKEFLAQKISEGNHVHSTSRYIHQNRSGSFEYKDESEVDDS